MFRRGRDNPVPQRVSDWLYDRFPRLRERQAPKDLLIPVGALGWAQERLPVQLVRIGGLYLVCLPIEVTVTAGLRLRRAVAETMSTDVEHVIVQGYANGYAHYLTTPEEYDAQEYEGGSTIFGRHQLSAFVDVVTDLAVAVRDGRPVDAGEPPPPHRWWWNAPTGSPRLERPQPIVVRSAPASVRQGWTVQVEVAADHPNRSCDRPTCSSSARRPLATGRSCPTTARSTPRSPGTVADADGTPRSPGAPAIPAPTASPTSAARPCARHRSASPSWSSIWGTTNPRHSVRCRGLVVLSVRRLRRPRPLPRRRRSPRRERPRRHRSRGSATACRGRRARRSRPGSSGRRTRCPRPARPACRR